MGSKGNLGSLLRRGPRGTWVPLKGGVLGASEPDLGSPTV